MSGDLNSILGQVYFSKNSLNNGKKAHARMQNELLMYNGKKWTTNWYISENDWYIKLIIKKEVSKKFPRMSQVKRQIETFVFSFMLKYEQIVIKTLINIVKLIPLVIWFI